MATSVVYASIFAAVLASIPAVQTKLVVFDTAIVDLTDDEIAAFTEAVSEVTDSYVDSVGGEATMAAMRGE